MRAKYIVVRHTQVRDFGTEVEARFAEGYKLHGGLCVTEDDSHVFYHQALIFEMIPGSASDACERLEKAYEDVCHWQKEINEMYAAGFADTILSKISDAQQVLHELRKKGL